MSNIELWNITYNIDTNIIIQELDKFEKKLFLLDLSKNKNDFSIEEQIVYQISNFHINRLNIKNDDTIFIEFWFKNKPDLDSFHLDCDEVIKHNTNIYHHPLLSCVTYFNEHNCPTIITDVDFNTFKFKEFENQKSLFFSFPKSGKQITFSPEKFHGTSNIFNNDNYLKERYILAINIWNKQPHNIPFYTNNSYIQTEILVNIESSENSIKNIQDIEITNKYINYQFYEDLLYNKHNNLFFIFQEFISENSDNDNIRFLLIDESLKKLESSLKNKFGNIIDDYNIINNNEIELKYNRFLQRFQYKNVYTNDICKWIISESEKYASLNGGWTTKRHKNYPTTDIPIERIKSIFNFILQSFSTITEKIIKAYNLPSNININYIDVFIVKYEANQQSFLELHKDGSFLSFQILLSNTTDFEGGGTYFDDGLIMNPEQGDLIIHCSKINHSGLPITKGKRYLLVGFINLCF